MDLAPGNPNLRMHFKRHANPSGEAALAADLITATPTLAKQNYQEFQVLGGSGNFTPVPVLLWRTASKLSFKRQAQKAADSGPCQA